MKACPDLDRVGKRYQRETTAALDEVLAILDKYHLRDLLRARLSASQRTAASSGGCIWNSCGRPVKAGGLCATHYQRQVDGTPPMDAPIRARRKSQDLHGTPVEVRHNVEEHERRTDCPGYSGCLDFVILRGWEHWTCDACPGYGRRQRGPGAQHGKG